MVVETVKHRHDGMVVTQSAHSGFVKCFSDVMGGCEMIDLVVELVSNVENDLSEEPVIFFVERSVGEVTAGVRTDTQGKQVAIFIDVEQSRGRSSILVVVL